MKKLCASLLFLLLLSVACAPEAASPPKAAPGQPAGSQVEKSLPPSEPRMMVRSAQISLSVANVLEARNRIAQLAQDLGGYVVSSRMSGDEGEVTGSVSLRVPDGKLEQALAELRKLAVRVRSESTSSKDITEEYVDLQARLKNAEATENQYMTLLGSAKDVDATLKIYERLSQVRREIEQIKGRMQLLERTSALSLIEIRLEAASVSGLIRAGWDGLGILRSAVRGFFDAVQLLAALAIWVMVFVPIWGPIVAIVYWVRRRRKSRAPKA